MRLPCRSGVVVALAVVLAVAVGMPLSGKRGTWYDPYLDAVEALEAGDAARAVDLLEAALSRRPESGYHRTYGTNYIHYTPHARLAFAWQMLGDCAKALRELERAEAAGELVDDPSLAPRGEVVRRACTPAPRPEVVAVDEGASRTPPSPPVPALDPARLERGVAAFLAGDLETADRIFSRTADDAADSAIAQSLLALVRFARWTAGGRRDDALIAEVRQAVGRARALDPLYSPPPALCPPELLALWDEGR